MSTKTRIKDTLWLWVVGGFYANRLEHRAARAWFGYRLAAFYDNHEMKVLQQGKAGTSDRGMTPVFAIGSASTAAE